jgi:tetratricopeptide (TPR) repeat protein
MKNPIFYLFCLIVLGGVLNYYISYSPVTEKTKREMASAYKDYERGETAKSLGERREAFNQALKLYTEFETQYGPNFGDGVLYYNIANSYFQLEEYPMAVLYYYRALQLMPRDEKASNNLQVTLGKLGIEPKNETSVFQRIFFFHTHLSLPERLQLFSLFAIAALILSSAFIWQRRMWMKKVIFLLALFSSVMLISLGYSHYLAPIEGVIIRSTGLFRDAGFQYAKVVEDPVLSGNKVEVVDVLEEGKWLKVLTPDGHLGYIPSESVRII